MREIDNETFALRVRGDGRTVEYASDAICPTAPAHAALFPLAYRISALLRTERWTE